MNVNVSQKLCKINSPQCCFNVTVHGYFPITWGVWLQWCALVEWLSTVAWPLLFTIACRYSSISSIKLFFFLFFYFFPLIPIIALGPRAAIALIWIITFCTFLLVIVRAHNSELVSTGILSKFIFSKELKSFISKMTLVIVTVVEIIHFMSVGHILLFFIKNPVLQCIRLCVMLCFPDP